jgi:hypothetical protein
VGLLPETLAAEGAAERLLAGVGPDVDVDGVAVLETLELTTQKTLTFVKDVAGNKLECLSRSNILFGSLVFALKCRVG